MGERWHLSHDGEFYDCGAYATRAEAVRAGCLMYQDIEDGREDCNDLYADKDAWRVDPIFYVGLEMEFRPAIMAEDVIETLRCQAYDYAGEYAEGWLVHVSPEEMERLRASLQDAFDSWMRETHNEPGFFMVGQEIAIDPRTCALEDFS